MGFPHCLVDQLIAVIIKILPPELVRDLDDRIAVQHDAPENASLGFEVLRRQAVDLCVFCVRIHSGMD